MLRTSNVAVNNNQMNFEEILFNARKAVEEKNWVNIEKYYTLLQEEFPKDVIMEATFFRTVAKVMNNDSLDNYQKRNELCKVLDVIEKYYDVTENKEEVLQMISNFLFKMAFPTMGNYNPKFYDTIIILNNKLEQLSKTHNEEYIYNLILKNKQMINTKNTVNGRLNTYSRDEAIKGSENRNKNLRNTGMKFVKFIKVIWCIWTLILTVAIIRSRVKGFTSDSIFTDFFVIFVFGILPYLLIKGCIKLYKMIKKI